MKKQQWISVLIFLSAAPAFAAIPAKVFQQGSRYHVNMRIGLKGSAPFSVSTIAKPGHKASVTEISEDGQTETSVVMMPHKSFQNQRAGLLINVTVTKKFRGNLRATEKAQIFALENQESELHLGRRGHGRDDLSLAVLANPLQRR